MTTSAQPAAAGCLAVLRPMEPTDGPQVLEVYAQGLATGSASFEVTPPDRAGWDSTHLSRPRLVATLTFCVRPSSRTFTTSASKTAPISRIALLRSGKIPTIRLIGAVLAEQHDERLGQLDGHWRGGGGGARRRPAR